MFQGVIVGYRTWKVDPNTFDLCGPVSRIIWPHDAKLEARCEDIGLRETGRSLLRHASPGEKCPCGIYAFHDVESAKEVYGEHSLAVLGVAAFWGRISVHPNGFKSQYGRTLALADHKEHERTLGWSSTLEGVTARYNIPAIPVDLLASYGATFGEPLGVRFEEE